MKQTRFFTTLLVAMFFIVSTVNATTKFVGDGFDIGVTPETPITPGVNPLSLTDDIDAYYFAGVLTITTNVDLSIADICVTNLSTGDEWSDSINGIGASVLNIGHESGYYIIEVYTDSGVYSGRFAL